MKKLILILLLFTSCKKEQIEPEPKEPKLLTWTHINAAHWEFTVNGTQVTPPVNVYTGDDVRYSIQSQPSTPPRYDLKVNIYVDGILQAWCVSQSKFSGQFIVE